MSGNFEKPATGTWWRSRFAGAADVSTDDYSEAPDGQVAWAAATVVAASDDP
jgi:hypothetical protein